LIAEELKVKLKGYAEVSTLHSFGFRILRKLYNFPQYKQFIKVDDWKIQKYVRANVFSLSQIISPSTDAIKVYMFSLNVQRIYDLARVNLIQHGEKKKLEDLCDEHNIVTLFDETRVVDILLADAYRMPKDLVIDYVDMIVLPLFHVEQINPLMAEGIVVGLFLSYVVIKVVTSTSSNSSLPCNPSSVISIMKLMYIFFGWKF
jgi:hypothetical protein